MQMPAHAAAPTELTAADVQVFNPEGAANLIFVCEHATNFMPEEYEGLGLDDAARADHIAWDPGAWEVACRLGRAFDAPVVAPAFSRLLFDCNRPLSAPSAIPEISEDRVIPGNKGLADSDRRARHDRIYLPYRRAVESLLARATEAGRSPAFVTVHSFTPVFMGRRRTLDLGVLYDADDRLAQQLLRRMAAEGELDVRGNEPYGPADGVTYTLVEHALPLGLVNAMIEIRNDLINTQDRQAGMARRIERHLRASLADMKHELGQGTGAGA